MVEGSSGLQPLNTFADTREHTICRIVRILHDIDAGDAQGGYAFFEQPRVALFVVNNSVVFSVLRAVHFNGQVCFWAVEVQDKGTERMLAANRIAIAGAGP